MKGIIILPKHLKAEWTPKSSINGDDFGDVLSVTAPLYYAIRDRFGFEIRYADEVNVGVDTDIVFMFGVPYHNRTSLPPGILNLDKKIKLVVFTGDVQCYGDKLCLDNRIKVYNRCDVILSQSYEYFEEMYPQFLSKFEFFPLFFSPHDRYTKFLFNDNPMVRCLLSGSLNKDVYPLRSLIVNKHHADVDYKSPTYVGDNYAKLLHSYFCCVTSASIFNYVLAKYFEITATGSLLLASETKDSRRLGLIPHRHYVPITKDNVFTTIEQCLKNPNDYNDIRREGMGFVRKNHSVVNRIEQLKRIFDELFN